MPDVRTIDSLRWLFWQGDEQASLQSWHDLGYTANDLVFQDPSTGELVDGSGAGMDTYQPRLLVARKTLDETVNNNATMQNDDELTVAVEANKVYLVRLLLVYSTGVTPDLDLSWGAPSGSTLQWAVNALGFNQSGSTINSIDRFALAVGSARPAGGTTTQPVIALPTGLLVVGGTAGSLTLRWSQDVADASDTTVHAGSLLTLEEVA